MATTYAYAVRDRAGKIINGQLEADSQAISIDRKQVSAAAVSCFASHVCFILFHGAGRLFLSHPCFHEIFQAVAKILLIATASVHLTARYDRSFATAPHFMR